ncbi:carbamate kinase [Youngiibacter multivorans]|uniref:Carbamate kinase n=1 Tax=Youngiibacter multivorans TaxID=937251 RepID=A0ABS4FZ80_9CLOT|nr:carbamate kinase [Youngiibacter multivorans]MBP1917604.1 carbamate kinase [Youngiibacter multivorans]
MGKRIVVALGGNALGNSVSEQLAQVSEAAVSIANLVETGNDLVITHGNGPQVGMIHKGLNHSYSEGVIGTEMPFAECSALSGGYIGYHIQNALINEFKRRGIEKQVATVITQVVVDPQDPAFLNPSKPIGEFVSLNEAERISEAKGYVFVEDSGRGYRRVVPSPLPIDIVEIEAIRKLSNEGMVVIACGGGGIPVITEGSGYKGVDAVIDKDATSNLLAEMLDANVLMVLTAVDNVAINFNKPDMEKLQRVSRTDLEKYVNEGHFAKGSMLPKVLAAISFVRNRLGREAVITSLENSAHAIAEGNGTIVYEAAV